MHMFTNFEQTRGYRRCLLVGSWDCLDPLGEVVRDCTEVRRLHCIIHACNIFCHLLQLSACDVCQRMNRKLTTGTPQLNPIAVKAPWHMLGIDFVGPISPPATDGSVYILTITDYFTKWVEAVPTTNKEASSVATCLFKVCKHVHK